MNAYAFTTPFGERFRYASIHDTNSFDIKLTGNKFSAYRERKNLAHCCAVFGGVCAEFQFACMLFDKLLKMKCKMRSELIINVVISVGALLENEIQQMKLETMIMLIFCGAAPAN